MGSSKPNILCNSQQLSIFFLFFVSLIVFFLTIFTYTPNLVPNDQASALSPDVNIELQQQQRPQWLDILAEKLDKRKIRVGLVNMDEAIDNQEDQVGLLFEDRVMETFHIKFDKVREDLKWEKLYPEWIDEDVKYGKPPSCPEIPMAAKESHDHSQKVDVLVARSPCGIRVSEGKGVRDVFRLQVNLIVADLALKNSDDQVNDESSVFVVFTGQCEPMLEIFKCDELLSKGDGFWIYKPNLMKLKKNMEMPFGSCQLAPLHQNDPLINQGNTASTRIQQKPRHAYVTLLHSSEAYVCGAIALAQSIKQTNSTKDLVLLADDSISARSIRGLRAAGWKIRAIKRIRSPHAVKGAYNEWNYSKLRVWQLIEYDKVMFIDSDLIVVHNIDHFFQHPQLSAAGNDRVLFNSGVMLVEPSECMFQTLMRKSVELVSYNGGDQGFLNEVFTWWHRWPGKINTLKMFKGGNDDAARQQRVVSNGSFAIHYLGLKPWVCYRDYDCNWDMEDRQIFASDVVHEKWWRVYDRMSEGLRAYCGLTKKMELRIMKWRGFARRARLADGHWNVKVRDPRQHNISVTASS